MHHKYFKIVLHISLVQNNFITVVLYLQVVLEIFPLEEMCLDFTTLSIQIPSKSIT